MKCCAESHLSLPPRGRLFRRRGLRGQQRRRRPQRTDGQRGRSWRRRRTHGDGPVRRPRRVARDAPASGWDPRRPSPAPGAVARERWRILSADWSQYEGTACVAISLLRTAIVISHGALVGRRSDSLCLIHGRTRAAPAGAVETGAGVGRGVFPRLLGRATLAPRGNDSGLTQGERCNPLVSLTTRPTSREAVREPPAAWPAHSSLLSSLPFVCIARQ